MRCHAVPRSFIGINIKQQGLCGTERPYHSHIMEEKLIIENSIADLLPAMVKSELTKMDHQKQEMFVEEFKRKKKSTGMAYFFLLVCLGMPYGYIGKWGLQLAYWFTSAGLSIWFFYLLFKLPSIVKEYNKDVALEVMRNLKILS